LLEALKRAVPGNGRQMVHYAGIAKLRNEVAKLKMECDILKKAAAYFAKESM
jgi:transposase